MARALSVYGPTDVESTSNGWRVRDSVEPQFEQPLGSESAVREFWSSPAAELGLPLLASLYDEGFYRGIFWSGHELDQALRELASLEEYWARAPYDDETRADLCERAGWMRDALRLAARCQGWVSVI